MDFPQVAPQNLEAIFSQNPGMWGMAQDYMQRANQGNDLSMQHQQLQNSFDQQSQPFKLAQLGLQNDTTRAQLPGVAADSSMKVRKNGNENDLNDDVLKDLHGKYKAAELKRHVDDLDNVGTMFRQYANTVENAPAVPGQRPADGLKAKLKAMGMEGMINPEWDNLDPATLATTLATVGDKIGNESTKYRSAMDMFQAKAATQQALQDKKDAASMERERLKAQTRMSLQKAVADAKQAASPKTWEAVAAQATLHAANLEDGAEKEQTLALANMAQTQAVALKSASAGAGQAGKIDAAATAGLPALKPPEPTPIAVPAKNPKASAPSGERIRVKSPDGKTGTISAAQKDAALKAGYTLE